MVHSYLRDVGRKAIWSYKNHFEIFYINGWFLAAFQKSWVREFSLNKNQLGKMYKIRKFIQTRCKPHIHKKMNCLSIKSQPNMFSWTWVLMFYVPNLMGVLALHLCTLEQSASPLINMTGNGLAHVSAKTPLNISPKPTIFQVLEAPFPPKIA